MMTAVVISTQVALLSIIVTLATPDPQVPQPLSWVPFLLRVSLLDRFHRGLSAEVPCRRLSVVLTRRCRQLVFLAFLPRPPLQLELFHGFAYQAVLHHCVTRLYDDNFVVVRHVLLEGDARCVVIYGKARIADEEAEDANKTETVAAASPAEFAGCMCLLHGVQ